MFPRALALAVFVAAALALATPVPAATVHLRIEGATETLFDGNVSTAAHDVIGHVCDGTNGGANADPGPTMTGALDDSGLSWSGTWFDSFDDFAVDRIGPDAADNVNFRYWGLVLDYLPTQVGGCQQQVGEGDDVLFAYDLFSKTHILRLESEQNVAAINSGVVYTVTDGQTGAPVEGAAVGGKTTDASGHVTLFYPTTGSHTVKAEKSDSVRSNPFTTCVYEPAAGGCGFTAPPPPPPPPPGPAPAKGAIVPPAVERPACSSIDVSGPGLRAGRRTRLEIVVTRGSVPVAGVQVRLRARGIDLRRTTDGSGRVSVVVVPKARGTLHIAVYGEVRRCGVGEVPIRAA